MRRPAAWTAVLVAIAALALLLLRREEPPAPAPRAPAPERAPEIAALPAPPVGVEEPVRPPPPPPPPSDLAARRMERVETAMALLRFPLSSQPLTSEMTDVLAPNRRHERRLPLSVATGTPAKELSYLLTADAYAVVGDAPITVTLEVFRGETRVPIDLRAARLTRGDDVLGDVPLNDEGRDGDRAAHDGTYAATFRFAGVRARSGFARLDVDIVVAGERAHASLDFRVTAAAPARFEGVVGERLGPDGLAIDVGLRVVERGRYFVQGLLFDADDRPIGMATARPTLEAGAQTVSLEYFGLLFHEARARAPYTFRTLTGHRMPEGDEPDRADMIAWDGAYRTRAYSLADFAEKEHESAAKERKLRALTDLAIRAR